MRTAKLNNVILYAKNWYEQSDDVWSDLSKCLNADNYFITTKYDIINIIVNNFTNLFTYTKEQLVLEIWRETSIRSAWKYGYYYKNWNEFDSTSSKLEEYDEDKALIHFYLSKIRTTDIEILGELNKPDDNVLLIRNIDKVNEMWKD